jgi:16S rRNA (uracil1498-N3)-methyltransferase
MAPRLHIGRALAAGDAFELPAAQARHVQVLRLQPGAALRLFDGRGGEWIARVVRMGRSSVDVEVDAHVDVDRELARPVTLALGMPANERMDALVEKATELGVAAIQPLVCERSVLRLHGDRAVKKRAHWEAVAIAACEQSGRNRVPVVAPVATLADWLAALPDLDVAPDAARATRWLLSLHDAAPLRAPPDRRAIVCLSGPEGGLTEAEESAARARGFTPVSLGPRVLRADTAPLAVLACMMVDDDRDRIRESR